MQFQQSEATAARRRVPLHLVDETDGITPELGEAGGQPQISKNGAAFGNTSATLTAIGNGAYYVELVATELDTLGFFIVRFKSAATAEFQIMCQVIAYDPYAAALSANVTFWQGVPVTIGASGPNVTVAGMDNDTITAAAIAANAIGSSELANGAIGTAQFQVGAIDASVVADDTITNAKIASGAITSSEAPNLDAAVSSRATPAQVNSEVSDVLKTDTITLPGQTAPPLSPTFEQALAWLYKAFRNRKTQTATQWSLMAENETTVDAKATVSDDGTTATKQEIVSGP